MNLSANPAVQRKAIAQVKKQTVDCESSDHFSDHLCRDGALLDCDGLQGNVHRGIAHSTPGPIRAGALYYARLGRASSVLYPWGVLGLLGLSIYSTLLGAITRPLNAYSCIAKTSFPTIFLNTTSLVHYGSY